MSYDNGGMLPSAIEYYEFERVRGLEETIDEQEKEIARLKKEIETRDKFIESLKSDYVKVLEEELLFQKAQMERQKLQSDRFIDDLKDEIKRLNTYIDKQSIVESAEREILKRVYEWMHIVKSNNGFYQLDFILQHYRMMLDEKVKDYLIEKGVKYDI